MDREFSPATAEQVVGAVEAVYAREHPTSSELVASFLDLPTKDQAEAALKLAIDLGLLACPAKDGYTVNSPLCRFLSTPNQDQKAEVLRVAIESYLPFVTFRERLNGTNSADQAAKQTKALLSLTAHPQDIMSTLISLGTYTQAIESVGGNRYRCRDISATSPISAIVDACKNAAASEDFIRQQIGRDVAQLTCPQSLVQAL